VSLEIEEAQPAVPAESPLSVAEEQGLLRIAQEALNNVVKHSGAREAVVRLRLQPPSRMEIEDGGQGFDVQGAREGAGIGLASMRERAGEIGWKVAVVSSVGKGTRIVVEPDFRMEG
jgi:signal transduction histidine kinase